MKPFDPLECPIPPFMRFGVSNLVPNCEILPPPPPLWESELLNFPVTMLPLEGYGCNCPTVAGRVSIVDGGASLISSSWEYWNQDAYWNFVNDKFAGHTYPAEYGDINLDPAVVNAGYWDAWSGCPSCCNSVCNWVCTVFKGWINARTIFGIPDEQWWGDGVGQGGWMMTHGFDPSLRYEHYGWWVARPYKQYAAKWGGWNTSTAKIACGQTTFSRWWRLDTDTTTQFNARAICPPSNPCNVTYVFDLLLNLLPGPPGGGCYDCTSDCDCNCDTDVCSCDSPCDPADCGCDGGDTVCNCDKDYGCNQDLCDPDSPCFQCEYGVCDPECSPCDTPDCPPEHCGVDMCDCVCDIDPGCEDAGCEGDAPPTCPGGCNDCGGGCGCDGDPEICECDPDDPPPCTCDPECTHDGCCDPGQGGCEALDCFCDLDCGCEGCDPDTCVCDDPCTCEVPCDTHDGCGCDGIECDCDLPDDSKYAIVETEDGPRGLMCEESPRVKFVDHMKFSMKEQRTIKVPIDRTMRDACAKKTIRVSHLSPYKPVPLGAYIRGDHVVIKAKKPITVEGNLVISGIRKGFEHVYFPRYTEEEMKANRVFWRSWLGSKDD